MYEKQYEDEYLYIIAYSAATGRTNGLKLFLKKHSYFQPETMNSPTDVISTRLFWWALRRPETH